ncbi:MAG: FtsX-like permease family protein [Candidatus Thiosymbion ectosymbiont of Robbea hypermnestra]|nr:FtsX-like permease family protein [Candidatus Thiosymbion ectosymbiont of Robbea hypermnestra]
MTALNRKLLRDLGRMWSQILAIITVIAVGTGAYIILIGTADSIQQTQVAYYERYHFADIFSGVQRAPNGLVETLQHIDDIQEVSTTISYTSLIEIPGQTTPANSLISSLPTEGGLNQLHIRQGRMPKVGSSSEVLVAEPFAQGNDILPGDTLYATLRGEKRKLEVVGIALSPEFVFFGVPGAMIPDKRRFGVMWMDRSTMESAYDMEGAFNGISVALVPGARKSEIINELDAILDPYGGTGSYDRSDQVSHATITSEINQLRTSTRYAAPIFVGIVAFLLHMLMKRHIETEREQIGALKAQGYSHGNIASHYAKFVLVIFLGGITVGFAISMQVGRVVTGAYATSFHFPFLDYFLRPSIFVEVSLIQGVAAFMGSFGNLRKAVLLQPAIAIRPPPPPVYRRTNLESWINRIIHDQSTRMIIRHIIRWPLRSGMTIFAIAGATAILIAPLGTLNSTEQMSNIHFYHAERQDMTVAFGETPPFSAVYELGHYSGVLAMEAFRAISARIEFEGRSRRVTVLGRESHNDLSRPLDHDFNPINIPKNGLVIADSMAEWLGVRCGDMVRLHFLEDRRPVVDIPVVALSKSYIGMTFFMVFMNLDKLNTILMEGRAISGIHIKLDPRDLMSFYEAVKKNPAVTGTVSHGDSKSAMRRALEQITHLTRVSIIIAGIIVFGAVYNSALIALAERSREFAGMRLLGYSRFAVSYILLGELLLLSFIALPLGCAMGYSLAYLLTEGTANEMFRLPLALKYSSIGSAILTVIMMVVVTGIFIARKIYHLDLIAVLKTQD